MASKDSTDGATPTMGKAVQAMGEVGGVRSSDDPVPGLWFGELTEERRDATCSAGVKSNEGRGDGPQGLPAPEKVRKLQITLYRKAKSKPEYGSENSLPNESVADRSTAWKTSKRRSASFWTLGTKIQGPLYGRPPSNPFSRSWLAAGKPLSKSPPAALNRANENPRNPCPVKSWTLH